MNVQQKTGLGTVCFRCASDRINHFSNMPSEGIMGPHSTLCSISFSPPYLHLLTYQFNRYVLDTQPLGRCLGIQKMT